AHSVAIMRSPFASQKVYHPANGRNVYVGFKYRF
ncbi:outer membrane insertion signal domain protein, partial [Fusobacterium necrophorum D12]